MLGVATRVLRVAAYELRAQLSCDGYRWIALTGSNRDEALTPGLVNGHKVATANRRPFVAPQHPRVPSVVVWVVSRIAVSRPRGGIMWCWWPRTTLLAQKKTL